MTTKFSDDGVEFADGNKQKMPSSLTPVAQAVQMGKVDSNGAPDYGTFSGLTVTLAADLVFNSTNGLTSRTATIPNGSTWVVPSSSGTYILYGAAAASNVGSTAVGVLNLIPVYQEGGTYSVTSGQHTYNKRERVMTIGNGTTADQAYRTAIGEAVVSGGVITSVDWYPINDEGVIPWFAVSATSLYTKNHNLGKRMAIKEVRWSATATGLEGGGSEADPTRGTGDGANANFRGIQIGQASRNVVFIRTQDLFQVLDGSGTSSNPTSGYMKIFFHRDWK